MRVARTCAFALVAVVALAATARRAAACASCGCGDPTLTATGVERPYKNRIRVAWEERYGSLTMGDDETGEHTQFLRSTLAASWTPWKRLTIGAILPWVTSWIQRPPGPQGTVNGLGDLELAARLVVFQEKSFAPHHVIWAMGGLKFPTGPRVTDSMGFVVPPDDQPGSGSWDPFGGITYAWFSGELTSFFASGALRWTTRGWDGYRRGSSIVGSLAFQLQPWTWGALQLGGDFVWQQSDTLMTKRAVPNTGGTTGYLAVAFLANPWRDLLIRVAVDAPLLMDLNGTQSVGPQVVAQISYDFN
ncbi:MAG TPA: hypothetical protein VN947_20900 [Polyangia bacterium]|nr:hypothetical protein [Polyangia bacterium]